MLPHETCGEDWKPPMTGLVQLGEVQPTSPTNPSKMGVIDYRDLFVALWYTVLLVST